MHCISAGLCVAELSDGKGPRGEGAGHGHLYKAVHAGHAHRDGKLEATQRPSSGEGALRRGRALSPPVRDAETCTWDSTRGRSPLGRGHKPRASVLGRMSPGKGFAAEVMCTQDWARACPSLVPNRQRAAV